MFEAAPRPRAGTSWVTMAPEHQNTDQGESLPLAPEAAGGPGVLGSLSSKDVLDHADWLRKLARGLVRDVALSQAMRTRPAARAAWSTPRPQLIGV